MIYFYYVVAFLQIILAFQSLRGGFVFRDYIRRELGKKRAEYTPFVSVVAPCRGIDDGLRENLQALFGFDYPDYEIIFAVDAIEDAAVATINGLIAENGGKSRLVIAGKASGESQKIHNMREALRTVSAGSEVFVFFDSDARPVKNWLRNLVAPLIDENVGAASGYRWFVQTSGKLATHLRAAWNASIVSILGANGKSNFCWGGATAIRRTTFEKLNISEKWRGKLSSDYTLTNALKEMETPVYFVPQCLTASVEETDWAEMLEFTTRQMKLTQIYSPERFKMSLIGSLIFTLVFWGGIAFLLYYPPFSFHFNLISGLLLFIFVTGTWKAVLRIETVKSVLVNYGKQLDRQKLSQSILWLFTPLLYVYNDLKALSSKNINWRGITYRVESPDSTEILPNDRK